MMSPMSAEATVVRNYIDWILSLPWAENTEDKLDIAEAEKILDEDHYGLQQGQGAHPRVPGGADAGARRSRGRSSASSGRPASARPRSAKSIARATDRHFVRISLGGVRDEAEIRGHRRTYIGALPGKIIQSLKKAGTSNPVFLLDEVDKMSTDFRGDPSAALLEVLDPEQNDTFNDHYLDLDYDLSKVMFICTANTMGGIPRPAAGPHGGHPAGRLHRAGEALHRAALPDPQAAGDERAGARAGRPARGRRCGSSSSATPRRPACARWSARSPASAARSPRTCCSRGEERELRGRRPRR